MELASATEVGGVAGEPASSVDVDAELALRGCPGHNKKGRSEFLVAFERGDTPDAEFGRCVSRKVHCCSKGCCISAFVVEAALVWRCWRSVIPAAGPGGVVNMSAAATAARLTDKWCWAVQSNCTHSHGVVLGGVEREANALNPSMAS